MSQRGTVKRVDLQRKLARKKRLRLLKLALIAVAGVMLLSLLFNVLVKLPLNTAQPVDGILVLGGSIRREIYATKLAKQDSQMPILISQGSREPCIWLLFQRAGARFEQVWLEKCAHSTFDNFFYSVPILRRWHVHKVKLITSVSHLPRAKWLGEILLGAQGIATEVDLVTELGVPGNNESALKTGLDLTRSLVWALLSQVIQPSCVGVIQLSEIDLQAWQAQGFECEHQGDI